MSETHEERISFAVLDKGKGLPDLSAPTGEEYPLPAWYRSVYNIPLNQLGVEDICKACRQQIHLEHTIPLAFGFLKTDPLAGEMYDGELLVSLKPVPLVYWSQHETERLFLKSVIEAVLRMEEITEDVRSDAQELLNKIHTKAIYKAHSEESEQ